MSGPVALADVPAGRFHDQVARLSPSARARVLKHLGDAHIPFVDVDSLSADRDGMLFYACAFTPTDAGAQPILDPAAIQAAARAEGLAEAPVPISSPPVRHSKPGATNVIYLDFNGHTITGTAWNSGGNTLVAKPYDKDGDPTTFNDAEQLDIIRVWERVAEDYKPFNVDVTTEDPVTFTQTTGRILITPSVDASGQLMPSNTAGGVAYVGVFGFSNYPTFYSPALVYCDHLGPNNEGYIAEAASHEMGHNMGLSHDGLTSGAAYYNGHGSGETSWGPIMGTGYNRNVSQWSKGEYYLANNTEDDLAVISAKVGYRTDDYGDTNGTASPVTVVGNAISASGIISQTGEADRFSFTTGAGNVSITASPFRSAADTYGGNLDIQLELIDSTNTVLTTANPTATTGVTLSTTLAAGTYYVRVTGVGVGSPLSSTPDGYTSYASLGSYTLSGTIAVASFNKLSAGRYHSLRLNTVSLLYATGTNVYGQLGTGNTTTFNTPQLITLPSSTVTDLAAGGQHSLFLTSASELWATGINDNGQLNDGTIVAKSTPIKIATNVAGMAASVFHSAYLKTDGTLWTVGLNDEGQLGTGGLGEIHTAAQIATNVMDLAAGNRQTLFVKSDGTLWGTGDLYGSGSTTTTPIQLMTGVKAVSAGAYHSLILKTDGTLWAQGYNLYGQVGNGVANATPVATPVQIATNVKAIAAGYFHSAFIKTDNTLWVVGYNSLGQLGDGTLVAKSTPFQLATNVAAVSAGESYTLFLKLDGSLWGTGLNGNGQFGNGLTTSVTTPVSISVGSAAVSGAPTAPTLTAPASLDRLNVAWQPVGTATTYEVWRGTTNTFGTATRIAQNVRWAFYQDLTATAYTTYYYWVTAVNSAGTSAPSTSQTGAYGAPIAPGFTTQPLPQTAGVGATATFTVVTSGFPAPTLQWQRQPAAGGGFSNLSNAGSYSGVTTATLSVGSITAVMSGDQFRCVATNGSGSLNSNAVVLTIPTNAISYGTTTFPASAASGGLMSFTYNVTNTGTQTWGPNHYLAVSLVGGSYVTFPSMNGLTSGASQAVSISFYAPGTPGTYTYHLQALDNASGFFGPVVTLTLTVTAPANAVTFGTTTFPVSVTSGALVAFNYNVTNTGTLAWGSNYYLAMWQSGGGYVTFPSLNGIAAGASQTVNAYFVAPTTPGTYTYYLQALDNASGFFGPIITLTLTVTSSPNAISYGSTTFPANVAAGGAVVFTYNVTNTGTQPWGSSHYLAVWQSGGAYMSFPSLNGIAAGASQAVGGGFTAPGTPGTYTYYLQALDNSSGFFGPIITLTLTVH